MTTTTIHHDRAGGHPVTDCSITRCGIPPIGEQIAIATGGQVAALLAGSPLLHARVAAALTDAITYRSMAPEGVAADCRSCERGFMCDTHTGDAAAVADYDDLAKLLGCQLDADYDLDPVPDPAHAAWAAKSGTGPADPDGVLVLRPAPDEVAIVRLAPLDAAIAHTAAGQVIAVHDLDAALFPSRFAVIPGDREMLGWGGHTSWFGTIAGVRNGHHRRDRQVWHDAAKHLTAPGSVVYVGHKLQDYYGRPTWYAVSVRIGP